MQSKNGNICCEQVKTTATFKSQQTTKTWKIFHCETEYVICLMECIICNLQYVDENETPFSIRLNNHRKDVKDPKAILADKHFWKNGHRFNKHARFMIIDRLKNKPWQRNLKGTSYSKKKLLDTKIRNFLP